MSCDGLSFYKRAAFKTICGKLGAFLLCCAFTVLLLNFTKTRTLSLLKGSHKSDNQSLLITEMRSNVVWDNSDQTQDKGRKPTSCSVIDFLATIDASARLYDPDLVCDDLARTSDIVCRMYFRQIGLEHLAESTCMLGKPGRVPKVVYFVIFGTYIFKFWHYIAIMAAQRNISPSAVYIIGDQHPQGRWWQRVLSDIHGVR